MARLQIRTFSIGEDGKGEFTIATSSDFYKNMTVDQRESHLREVFEALGTKSTGEPIFPVEKAAPKPSGLFKPARTPEVFLFGSRT